MKIYTKSGDKGQTSLYDGKRVAKDSIRVESYGTIDELNSHLGFARNFIDDEAINNEIKIIQRKLFDVAGELATEDITNFPQKVSADDIQYLESLIDTYLAKINKDQQFKFILPGSNKPSGALHVARTVCRRGERRIITLSRESEIRPEVIKYINRLSDVIYTLGRYLEEELNYVDFEK